MKSSTAKSHEKGGFVLGLIVGLLLGLAIALGVALYVAKVPIPFIDKVPQRSAEEDAKEAAANKNWNPNANLPGAGKAPAPRAPAASGVIAAPAAASGPGPASPATAAAPAPTGAATPAPKASAAPAQATASAPGGGDAGYVFFVQAGAFTAAADAEQQRARLAMQGFNAKVYERAAGDRTVFRVRIGPFDERAGADALQAQVQAAGLEAAVVRTQR